LRGVPAKPIECGALVAVLGAGNAVVLVDLDNLAAHSASNIAQLALLIGRCLVQSRNAKVENDAFHRTPLLNTRQYALQMATQKPAILLVFIGSIFDGFFGTGRMGPDRNPTRRDEFAAGHLVSKRQSAPEPEMARMTLAV
jgi:hypothetical protein